MSDSDFEDETQGGKAPDVITSPTHYIEEGDLSLFLDKFSIIFGQSKTGKTYFVQSILNELRKEVPNFIVVTPTADYYKSLVPSSSIWETISEQSINDIVERQESAKRVRSITDKIEVLHLIHSIISPTQAPLFLEEMKKRGLTEEECVKMLRVRIGSGNPEVQEKVKKVLIKKMIDMEKAGEDARSRSGKGPTATIAAALASIRVIGIDPGDFGPDDFRVAKKERFNVYNALGIPEKSLKDNPPLEVLKIIANGYAFCDLNYRLALILDDVTPVLKKITNYSILEKDPFGGDPNVKKKPKKASDKKNIFLEIATRCRHFGLSCVIITHSFVSIERSVRTNANLYLFTHKEAFDDAMPEINAEDFTANKKYGFVNKVFTKKDEDGQAFTKLLYYKLDNDTTDAGQSKKLKMINAVRGDLEIVDTTRVIDDLITKHGDKAGGSYSF